MPANIIKSFAKKSGKSEAEVEKMWSQAKAIAAEKGLKDDSLFAYATATLKTMLKIKEDIELEGEVLTEAAFKSKDEALDYARKQAKKLSDSTDEIEVYKVKDGFEVNNSMNSRGRDVIKKKGAKLIAKISKKKEKLFEETGTSAVAMPQGPTGKMPCGTPFFDCDEDMFYSLHLKKRKDRGWYKKHYKDTAVADYARSNKGAGFYLHFNGMFRKVK